MVKNNRFIYSEMKCPFNDCYNQNPFIYSNQMEYQQHHINTHQLRDKNGNLLNNKESKWKCPECQSISQSFTNFIAHVTIHRNISSPPWICKLSLSTYNNSNNSNNSKNNTKKRDNKKICGKACSTKGNLIKHIRAVHRVKIIKVWCAVYILYIIYYVNYT